jgi:arylsulfatase A-like enzyme
MVSMDFLPTLLAAAGGTPDSDYPSDGMNLLPVLLDQAPVQSRTLYWRHKAKKQAAIRDGDWKYIQIDGKEHLFDLSYDSRERADMKQRNGARLNELKEKYNVWNDTMLPYPEESLSSTPDKYDWADRY